MSESDENASQTPQEPQDPQTPQVGEYAILRVASIEPVGAFLDWGLPKDLFLPFREQTRELQVGHEIIVCLYTDNNGRISSSMRLEKFLDKDTSVYSLEQKVELLIIGKTDLGFKAIINGKHLGILYQNEVFQDLRYADQVPGYIKKIREDGKIDLILQPFGSKGADDLGAKILAKLGEKEGFLPLTEKTSPEVIYNLFGVSKKKYKMALGGIYKRKLITIEPDGIKLVATVKTTQA